MTADPSAAAPTSAAPTSAAAPAAGADGAPADAAAPAAGTGSGPTRYRCAACGNLTRFDVVTTLRTRAFHHFSVGGELTVEEVEVLDESVEQVTCRWCGNGDAVETVAVGAADPS